MGQDKSLGISGSLINGGYGSTLYFHFYNTNVNKPKYTELAVHGGLGVISNAKGYRISYGSVQINLGYYFSLPIFKKTTKKTALAIGSSAFLGKDKYSADAESFLNGAVLEIENPSAFYGLQFGLDFEYYINYQLSLFIRLREAYKLNSALNQFVTDFSIGFQFYL